MGPFEIAQLQMDSEAHEIDQDGLPINYNEYGEVAEEASRIHSHARSYQPYNGGAKRLTIGNSADRASKNFRLSAMKFGA